MRSKERHRDNSSAPHSTKRSSKATTKNPEKSVEEHSKYLGAALIQMAWQVAATLIGFSVIGIFLDSRLDTKPTISIIGVVIGVIAVNVLVLRIVNKTFPDTYKRKDKK